MVTEERRRELLTKLLMAGLKACDEETYAEAAEVLAGAFLSGAAGPPHGGLRVSVTQVNLPAPVEPAPNVPALPAPEPKPQLDPPVIDLSRKPADNAAPAVDARHAVVSTFQPVAPAAEPKPEPVSTAVRADALHDNLATTTAIKPCVEQNTQEERYAIAHRYMRQMLANKSGISARAVYTLTGWDQARIRREASVAQNAWLQCKTCPGDPTYQPVMAVCGRGEPPAERALSLAIAGAGMPKSHTNRQGVQAPAEDAEAPRRTPAGWVSKVCPHCKQTFSYQLDIPSQRPRTYCSRSCASNAAAIKSGRRVERLQEECDCAMCGQHFEYERKPSQPVRRYCGVQCAAQGRARERRESKQQRKAA